MLGGIQHNQNHFRLQMQNRSPPRRSSKRGDLTNQLRGPQYSTFQTDLVFKPSATNNTPSAAQRVRAPTRLAAAAAAFVRACSGTAILAACLAQLCNVQLQKPNEFCNGYCTQIFHQHGAEARHFIQRRSKIRSRSSVCELES